MCVSDILPKEEPFNITLNCEKIQVGDVAHCNFPNEFTLSYENKTYIGWNITTDDIYDKNMTKEKIIEKYNMRLVSADVYIMQPLEGGTGGCYGDRVLSVLPLDKALNIDPYIEYGLCEPEFGHHPRICSAPDMNKWLYIYSIEDCKWVSRD